MTWKEYELTNRTIADWLPWSAITHENVMRCRDDGSVFGIIRYQPFRSLAGKQQRIALPSLGRGWCFWVEEQCASPDELSCYLTVFWNPFEKTDGMIRNAPDGEPVRLADMEEALAVFLHRLARSFPEEAEAKVLAYQEIIDVLVYTLAMNRARFEMPDPPVDLDAFLTQDLEFDFSQNRVRLNGEGFLVVSLPSVVGSSNRIIDELLQTLAGRGCPGRHVQRISLFDEAAAKKEMRKYTGRWCISRHYIKELLLKDAIGNLNGYYNHQLIFLLPEAESSRQIAFLEQKLTDAGLPFVLEDFNAKSFWWGSIPAIHTAAVCPPICCFDAIEELLVTTDGEEAAADVSDESFPKETASDFG